MKQPSKAFSARYRLAKQWQTVVRPSIEEIFKFCCPIRQHDFTEHNIKNYEVENFHSLPEELASDLAGDLVSFYTPPEAIWANYAVVTEVDEADADAVRSLVSERERDLFDMISMSNYNDVAPQWGFEAATHGTPALWVTQSSIADQMHVEIVPPNELLITQGHRGILDRFRETIILAENLEAALFMPGIQVDLSGDPALKRMMQTPGARVKVCWGFWVDWSDMSRPQWRMEITVQGKRVTEESVVLGEFAGSCPLLVGRFNPITGRPWGRGAGWKALPDMRTLDKVEEIVLTAMDDTLRDTFIYPDDGFIDMSEGLERGRAYPASRGFTRDRIYEFPKSPAPDAGYFQEAKLEDRLRVAFFQDGPRQTGDTPPSATQWLDERNRVQRRIGKPSAPLWTELFVPFIQRVEYLGVSTGRIPEALSHNGANIKVVPVSPLQRAQNQDKVLTARSNLDLGFSVFQDQLFGVVDPIKTFTNIIEASGDELTKLRDKEAPVGTPPQEGQ